ncbi:hypothetical protein B0O99DRAFT_745701 [Bisporella sp. PMI_857]|nr:hypothetical protein B0O99DRAFT_745701 [Bisporella sp. PMI_857]
MQISASLQMGSDNTTPEPPPTPSSSSSGGANSHTHFPGSNITKSFYSNQEPQEAAPSTVKFDDQPEYGNHMEIEATDGFQSRNLDTTPTETSSFHISTFGRLHNPQVLVQDGLEWEQETFDLKPAWGIEPSTNAVADWIPTFKTWSEVSTIALLRTKTTIPVPNVIAHSSSRENEIGFEWMLIERVVDVYPLKEVWRSLPWAAKTQLIEDVASVLGQLFDVRADAIGRIYQLNTAACKNKKASQFVVSRIVSMPFFWGDHIQLGHIPRGPFTSSRDWLHARLQLLLHDCTVLLANPGSGEAEKEDSLRTQAMVHRLLKLLPAIFPAEQESFALHHDDLSHQNILLDRSGTLKAIVDWECTSTMPFFMCCQLPGFLRSRERLDKPEMEEYSDPENEDSLYQEHLKDHELTLLRKNFIEFMQAKYPAWAEEHHAAGVRAEFESAVSRCDGPFSLGEVEGWLDRVEGRHLQSSAKD